MARSVLCLRRTRSGVGRCLVCLVPRFSGRCRREGAGGAFSRFPLAHRAPHQSILALLLTTACYAYVYNFFQTWFHTFLVKGRGFSEAHLLLSALPYAVAVFTYISGGAVSDYLVHRFGAWPGFA